MNTCELVSRTLGMPRFVRGRGALLLAGMLVVPAAFAQTNVPPQQGGVVYSLGMPPVYKGNAAVTLGSYRPGSVSDLSALLSMGVHKSLGSPVVGLAALGLEA